MKLGKMGALPRRISPQAKRNSRNRLNLTGAQRVKSVTGTDEQRLGQLAADAPRQLLNGAGQFEYSEPLALAVAEKAQLAPGRGRFERNEDSKQDFQVRRLSIGRGNRVCRRAKHGLLVAISFLLRDQNVCV